MREFTPRYEDAARPFRHCVGSTWSVDETHVKVAGDCVYVYRAIDGQGQIVDIYVSRQRAAEEAATFFRRAIASTVVAPDAATTDRAAAYPPALAAVLPGVLHEVGTAVQQRIERDHQHLKGRVHCMRGFTTLVGARVRCRAHALVRNLRGHFYDLGQLLDSESATSLPPLLCAWDALTATLLA